MTIKEFAKKYDISYNLAYNASYLVQPISSAIRERDFPEDEMRKALSGQLRKRLDRMWKEQKRLLKIVERLEDADELSEVQQRSVESV